MKKKKKEEDVLHQKEGQVSTRTWGGEVLQNNGERSGRHSEKNAYGKTLRKKKGKDWHWCAVMGHRGNYLIKKTQGQNIRDGPQVEARSGEGIRGRGPSKRGGKEKIHRKVREDDINEKRGDQGN